MDDDLIFRRTRGMEKYSAPEARASQQQTSQPASGAWWSIPLLCVALATIAWCVLIPACRTNQKMALEREKLHRDVQAVDKQIAVNDKFLERVSGDPELAERLAQRQMKFIPEGTSILDLPKPAVSHEQMSPFLLTAMPRPAPLMAMTTEPGILGKIANNSKVQLYLIGAGLLALAMALVAGAPAKEGERAS